MHISMHAIYFIFQTKILFQIIRFELENFLLKPVEQITKNIICCYFWKAQHFYVQVSFVSKIDDDSSVKSNMPFESWICQNERQQPNGSEFIPGYVDKGSEAWSVANNVQAVRLHLLKSAPWLKVWKLNFPRFLKEFKLSIFKLTAT